MYLQIYSTQYTTRLDYTIDLVFGSILGVKYKLVTDKSEIDLQKPLLNYSQISFDNSIQIAPHSILFEEEIKPQEISVEDIYFFKTNGSSIKYDILASSFYMATRYEEYLEKDLDEHGRYKAEKSLAFRHGFLNKAVVHRWASDLKKILELHYSGLEFEKRTYSYLSTIDIDSAYAFRAKGFTRLMGGLLKAVLRKDMADLKARLSFIVLGKKDPFDVYDELELLHEKHHIAVKYFFLVGKNGVYDKNIQLSKKAYRLLIERLSVHAKIGLHPSYQSNKTLDILLSEKKNFSEKMSVEIDSSRQHFLKLSWTKTYQNLIKSGIKKDYTMGFASQIGFRSGMCIPYRFFDLKENKTQALTIVPFQVMDGTLNQYLSLTPDDAWKKVQAIYEEVKQHDGLFVTLWHNESLSEMRNWRGWKGFYESMLKQFKN